MSDKIKEIIEKHIEWKLYKVLYIGILVPLLFEESRKWVSQNVFISIVFFAAAGILVLPIIFKVLNILKIVEEFK